MCKLNPKVDFAFKKLFGSEENKEILISFINSIISEENQIKNLELKNPYNVSNYKNGKMTILDIKAVDENGIWYDIEMQIAEQGFYDKRALYYWSKVYSDQLESGYDFTILRKTIAINILDFNYLKEEDFHNTYKIYNEKTKEAFSDLFEMHFIELTKFKKDYKDLKTALDRWVSFLNKAYEIDKDKIPVELAEDENIRKAVEKLEIMYLDKEEREIYENDLKAMRIHKAEIKTAEEKGIQKGIEKGEKSKSLEIAKNLLDVLDNETIAVKTGLTIEEIQKLR
jgi:predicted transposase/invertase (TIGR01784 family)